MGRTRVRSHWRRKRGEMTLMEIALWCVFVLVMLAGLVEASK